jgi:hypothetical protein
MWGRQAMFRPTRLSSISSERNTVNRAYGLHSRGQVVRDAKRLVITEISDFRTTPRHSACSACRRSRSIYPARRVPRLLNRSSL